MNCSCSSLSLEHTRVSIAPESQDQFLDDSSTTLKNTNFGIVPTVGVGFGHAFNEYVLLDVRVAVGANRQSSEYMGQIREYKALAFDFSPGIRFVGPGEHAGFLPAHGWAWAWSAGAASNRWPLRMRRSSEDRSSDCTGF